MLSLIITVKNEIKNIPDWLKSIREQSLQPDEIIVVDAGSEDGTREFLEKESEDYRILKIFTEPGNIAHGRNFAIRQSSGNPVVVTDAGCIYHPDWLKSLVQPFEKKEVVWATTAFAPWFVEADGPLVYSIAASTTPAKNEFCRDWRPSSRSVAFYRDRWQTVGGYPEWITYCEDVLFDLKLIRKDGQPFFVRETLVHWRPRADLASYFRQLFNYTRNEAHGKINSIRQVIRYVVYALSAVLLYLTFAGSVLFLIPLVGGMFVYISKFWHRWSEFTAKKSVSFRLSGLILVPFAVIFGDIAKMSGYVLGTIERLNGSEGEVEYY